METTVEHEAQISLTQLLERVSQGERITITKHGVPVAVIGPAELNRKREIRDAIESIKRIGARNTLGELTIREMIEEGRD